LVKNQGYNQNIVEPKGERSGMSGRLALHLLGPPKLDLNNAPVIADRRKTLALLAYLSINREKYTREYLSALLWPDYEQLKAFTNLRHALWETQQAIGAGWILADRETIALSREANIWLDVAEFDSLITENRAHAQPDVSLRIPLLTDSVKLYRNHFLTGFSLKDAPGFNEWAFAKSEELRNQLAHALTTLSEDHCSLGEAETAIPYAQRLITIDPLNESSHRLLMQVYIQAGQNNAALKQYQTCEKLLRKELGVDPQPETRDLYKQVRKGEIKPIQPIKQKEMLTPRHNIPFQISKFIGREKELEEVKNLIAEHRLVSLVGTGGIGKTRLSLKVGEGLLKEYANGVWLVELASLSDPALVPQTAATLFNVVEGSEEPLTEKLIRVLRTKNILLILDNCEHLLDACAQLVDALLKNCSNLKILTTSREPLGITGEAHYHVPPLALPDLQQILDKLLEYESVQLFEERARLVQEHFSLTIENSSSVTHICHRLDGIPLAIELAAARVDLYLPQQIAARLDESFNLLTGGSRTTLPRQQTLRASIDWSWNLLSIPEQILLRRLSIFAGGWTLDAAEAVCAGKGIETDQVFDMMTQLAAKSLVVVKQDSGRERRYRLLEMVRQYANEKLWQADEKENIRIGHLNYFLHLSEQIERELVGPQQMEWFARTNDERDNIRAALEYASKTNQVEAGLCISAKLQNFWESFDNSEGARWLAEFIQKPKSNDYPLARAKALCAQGWFFALAQQLEAAHSAAKECLALYRACGDQYGEVDGLNLLGFMSNAVGKGELNSQGPALAIARSLGDVGRQATALYIMGWDHSDFKRAFAYWNEAIKLYREVGNLRRLANMLSILGQFLVLEGDIESAQKCQDEASALFQQMNPKAEKGHLLGTYGLIAIMRGDYEQARAYFQENARINKELGSRLDYLWANLRLGHVAMYEGNITQARQVFSETARNFQKDGYINGLVFTLELMASLYVAVGKAEYATRLIGWADATREGSGDTRPFLEQVDIDRDIAAVVVKIGKDAFEEAYNKGCAMSVDEAVAYALDGE
jgi:predicted ATPase/DNA-binding SARP family transcriptional activator